MSTDYALQRSISDIQSRFASLDASMAAAVRRDRPRHGSLAARFAATTLFARLEKRRAEDVAAQYFGSDRDLARLIATRAASGPATTTGVGWAAELVQILITDIADTLLPESTLLQLRRLGLSYNFVDGGFVKVPTHSPAPSGQFVLEGNPVPVGALMLSSLTLKPKKAAGIVAVTREMLKGSPLNVETSLRTLLAQDIGLMVDGVLLGSTAATAAAPAGLLNGLTPLTPTPGGGSTALLGDIKKLMAAIAPAVRPVIIANAVQSASIAVLAQSPVPVIPAPTLPADQIIAVDAAAFASSLGPIDFSAGDEAALHMETSPLPIASGAQGSAVLATPTQSMWQQAQTALRILLDVDWQLRRSNAVAVVNSVTW